MVKHLWKYHDLDWYDRQNARTSQLFQQMNIAALIQADMNS